MKNQSKGRTVANKSKPLDFGIRARLAERGWEWGMGGADVKAQRWHRSGTLKVIVQVTLDACSTNEEPSCKPCYPNKKGRKREVFRY